MSVNQDNHDGQPLDLSPLDPTIGRDGLERFVREVRTAATTELLRRQQATGIDGQIVRLRRPILATSCVLALVSLAILLTTRSQPSSTNEAVAESLGIPKKCVSWMYAGKTPAAEELIEAGGGKR